MAKSYKYPNIEAERERFGYSREEIANKLDVSRKSYYNWLLNGNIPVIILIKLSDMFDCSIDYLLGRTRNPQKSA